MRAHSDIYELQNIEVVWGHHLSWKQQKWKKKTNQLCRKYRATHICLQHETFHSWNLCIWLDVNFLTKNKSKKCYHPIKMHSHLFINKKHVSSVNFLDIYWCALSGDITENFFSMFAYTFSTKFVQLKVKKLDNLIRKTGSIWCLITL